MKARIVQGATGGLMALSAAAFALCCVIQMLRVGVGTGRGKTDPTFYWNWVWTVSGIITAVVGVFFVGVFLFMRAADDE